MKHVASQQHLALCFDGSDTNFYPEGPDREEIARRFLQIVEMVHERPELAKCAAGACDGTCGHGPGWASA